MNKEKASIYDLRRQKRMTQRELAIRAGVTERMIVIYESDINKLRNASYKNVKNIANALDVSINEIFLSDDSENPKQPT
ncbi:helix-turn-helix domain-containing protein [Enterococcus sp. AZ128]|uniref:helix-turn-helix domain-containing protein n=2 Tax=unclassified Enterococcus TaxID=2608891 RepID=UPI003F23A072